MTYGPSIGGRVGALIGGLFLTVILSVAIPKLLIEGVLEIRTQSILVGCLALILVAGTVLTIVRVFVTGPVTVRTTPTQVSLHRAGRQRETWERANTSFASFVIRESTNGIPTGATRKLIATTAGERVETALPWFSAKTFNALIADVAPLVPASPTSFTPTPTVSSGSFTLNHSAAGRTRIVVLVILGIGLAAAAAFVAIGVTEMSLDMTLLIVGSGLVLIVVIAGAVLLRGSRVPRQVTVSQSALTFDDRVFPLGQLVGIVATPAGYENARGRRVTLVGTTGRRTVIGLGAGKRVFPEYEHYLEAIRGATTHRPGMFTLDVA